MVSMPVSGNDCVAWSNLMAAICLPAATSDSVEPLRQVHVQVRALVGGEVGEFEIHAADGRRTGDVLAVEAGEVARASGGAR